MLITYSKAIIVKILRSFDSSNYWVKDSSHFIIIIITLVFLLLNTRGNLFQNYDD